MALTHAALRQFTGTDKWYRHPLVRWMLYTEGVRYVAEEGGAYWLIDKVATLQLAPKIKTERFQQWKFVREGNAGTLTCDDGNDNVVHKERIHLTDFPLDEITFWVENNVICLPSER